MAAFTPRPDSALLERETTRKIFVRLLPFMMVGQILCFLDRVNISFAALRMNADLHLNPAAFGFASGVFYLSYFVCEVPSNLLMVKVGPKLWLARIMFTWGVIAMATAFVRNATDLYVVRFLLGAAEAGFFPGLVLYSTYWFRRQQQAEAFSWIFLGSSVATVIAGPLCGYLLGLHVWGLQPWRWLFIIEGLLPVLFGFLILALWTDRPESAKWLRPEQREWIAREVASEAEAKETGEKITVRQALTRPTTLVLTFVKFLHAIGALGMVYWMPQMVKSVGKGLTPVGVGWLIMLPNLCMIVSLLVWSRHSDRTGERHWHLVGATLVQAVALVAFPLTGSLSLAVLTICLAGLGMGGYQGILFTAGTKLLKPQEKAAGLALMNSGAAFGGFVGPWVAGIVKGMTGNYQSAMVILASAIFLSGLIMHLFYVRTGTGRERPAKAAVVA